MVMQTALVLIVCADSEWYKVGFPADLPEEILRARANSLVYHLKKVGDDLDTAELGLAAAQHVYSQDGDVAAQSKAATTVLKLRADDWKQWIEAGMLGIKAEA